MKKDRILNAQLIAEIAAMGHTEYLVIADAGLPIPKGVNVIDLSVVRGVPAFYQVLAAVDEELVSEAYIVAQEMSGRNADLYKATRRKLHGREESQVPHEKFKQLTQQAKVVVRTGETTPFANVILIAGVNF